MNIQEAKEEIMRTLRVYTQKDEEGNYRIPVEKQRPILLIGPPGIGKTAIMKQIAEETGMGLVSYTMTHHTRQSAIGLPFITERQFRGQTYSVTEYTMSEIVASIYIYIEETGIEEGILFLDEINCVSETLAPVMLQLLQNKTFGNHPLPEGWMIVAAGNPPEYNRSVRELDMVTLDRVKNMDIETDLKIWQRYAYLHQVHSAIRSYLTIYPEHFYRIENTSRGQFFVTARGWEDLSIVLEAYEDSGEEICDSLFLQYLQHDDIAHSFANYYRMFQRFAESEIGDLLQHLQGQGEPLKNCSPAEVLAIASLLFHQIQEYSEGWASRRRVCQRFCELLDQLPVTGPTERFFQDRREALRVKKEHEVITTEEQFQEESILRELEKVCAAEQMQKSKLEIPSGEAEEVDPEKAAQEAVRFSRDGEKAIRQQTLAELAETIVHNIDATYQLLKTSPIAQEAMLFFTTDLTNDSDCCQVLTFCPSELYLQYSRELLNAIAED